MEVRIEHLSKSYGGHAVLWDVNHTLSEGITCLMAPSGTGKTALLRLLLGLERPDGGTIRGLTGKRISAVFQEDRLLPQLDAEGNLRFALGADFEPAAARELLETLGLREGDKPVRDYSGGMRRRLALARALLADADFLALDEPFTGLDAENRAAAISCIRRYGAGRIVLLVSHEAQDAAALEADIWTLQGNKR